MMREQPYVVNPEAIGSPESDPVVEVPAFLVAFFERTRCPECDHINNTHADGCSRHA